jgi:hypothetical protein
MRCVYGSIHEDEKNNVYVIGSHQYALYYWLKALRENKIRPKAQLIHIDYHTDFLSPCIDISPTITPEDVRQLIESRKIQNDRFIKPAIELGIIDSISFCCYPSCHQPTGGFKNFNSPTALVDDFTQAQLCSNLTGRGNIILDIDLDFFYKPKWGKGLLRPKSKKDIKKEVCAINSLLKYVSITTIATSPEMYRKEFREYVELNFYSYFAIPLLFDTLLANDSIAVSLTNSCTFSNSVD